jgi:hypothetical protein
MRILGDWNWWPGSRRRVFRAKGEEAGGDGELLAGVLLAYLARRVERADGGESPHLLRELSELLEPDGNVPASERDRALRANEEILKPLALALLMDYLLKTSKQPTA